MKQLTTEFTLPVYFRPNYDTFYQFSFWYNGYDRLEPHAFHVPKLNAFYVRLFFSLEIEAKECGKRED